MPYLKPYPDYREPKPLITDYAQEEEDSYLPANPEKPQPVAPKSEAAPNPFGKPRTGDAYRELQKIEGERPNQPKPSLWRSLAAMGVGFAQGYANAGGRTRPVDPEPAMRAIQYGDYDQRVADWTSKYNRAQGRVNDAVKADQMEADYLEGPTKLAYMQAQTGQMNAATAAKNAPVRDEVDRSEIKEGKDGFYQVLTYKDGRTATNKLSIPYAETPKIATGQPIEASNADGKSVFIQRDPSTGKFEEVPGFAPPPEKTTRTGPTSGESMTQHRWEVDNAAEAETNKTRLMREARTDWEKSLEETVADESTGFNTVKRQRKPDVADLERLRAMYQRAQNAVEAEYKTKGIPFTHYEFPPVGGANPGLPPGAEWYPPAGRTSPQPGPQAGPRLNEERSYQGVIYRFDGQQWVRK